MLLNDESSTIKRFGKNAQIEYKNIFYESVWSKFSFFFIFHFFRDFLFFFFFFDRFEEKAPRHQKK